MLSFHNILRKLLRMQYKPFTFLILKYMKQCTLNNQYDYASCKTRNHSQISQITHKLTKPSTNRQNHLQTSQISDKPPKTQSVMTRKSVFYVTKNFSNNAKLVLNLHPFYSISSMFSIEDQPKQELRESGVRLVKRQPGKPSILHCSFFSVQFEFSRDFFSGK